MRASVEGDMRFMRREVMMLLVAGMEDSRINITSTMRLARVSHIINDDMRILPSILGADR